MQNTFLLFAQMIRIDDDISLNLLIGSLFNNNKKETNKQKIALLPSFHIILRSQWTLLAVRENNRNTVVS